MDELSRERIRRKAYELAERDGFRKPDRDYWHEAERQALGDDSGPPVVRRFDVE